MDILREILACGVEERRGEEDCVSFAERKAHPIVTKILIEFRTAVRQETLLKSLTPGQKSCRATPERHIRMRNCALQRQESAGRMYSFWPARCSIGGLEPKVVIAMRDLRSPARLDNVDLGSDAIGRAEVGGADVLKPRVREVGEEIGRGFEGMFGEGIPDSRICSAGGEVVAFCAA